MDLTTTLATPQGKDNHPDSNQSLKTGDRRSRGLEGEGGGGVQSRHFWKPFCATGLSGSGLDEALTRRPEQLTWLQSSSEAEKKDRTSKGAIGVHACRIREAQA